jgi:hypothetical protein
MERYWHYDVGLQKLLLSLNQFEKTLCEPGAKWFDTLKFQKQDRGNQLTLVKGETPGTIKMIRAAPTDVARKVLGDSWVWTGFSRASKWSFDGRAAYVANRWTQTRKRA